MQATSVAVHPDVTHAGEVAGAVISRVDSLARRVRHHLAPPSLVDVQYPLPGGGSAITAKTLLLRLIAALSLVCLFNPITEAPSEACVYVTIRQLGARI